MNLYRRLPLRQRNAIAVTYITTKAVADGYHLSAPIAFGSAQTAAN